MLNKHTKIIGIIALLLMFVGVGVLTGFIYKINVLEEQLQEQRKEIARARSRSQDLASPVRLVEETEGERKEFSSYVVEEEEEVIEFLALVSTLGIEQGVSLETIDLTVTEIDKKFEKLNLKVSAVGAYDSVMHTLTLFENLPYQSHVSGVSAARAPSEQGKNSWKTNFTVHVTKFKES